MSRLTDIVERAVSAAATATGPARTRDLTATHAPDAATAVVVETTNGSIDVEPATGDAVEVEATARTNREDDDLDAVSLDVHEAGDTVTVAADLPDGSHGVSVSFTVAVPDAIDQVRAETTNGSVTVSDVAGDATVETKNGSVDVDGIGGAVTAETKNGSISVLDAAVREARSKNGRITLTLSDVPEPLTAETKNGSITIRVPGDTDARFDLSSNLGSVDTEGVTCLVETESRTHLAGELGAGGPTIDATTSVGSVELAGR